MQKKGQGALEYLLLIGGAVLIAVIIIAVVTGMANTSGNAVNNAATCATKNCDQCKVATTTCVGKTPAGVTITWATGTTCTATDANAFVSCQAK